MSTTTFQYGLGIKARMREFSWVKFNSKNKEIKINQDLPPEAIIFTKENKELVKKYLGNLINSKENQFTSFHFNNIDLQIIVVPKNKKCSKPIKLAHHGIQGTISKHLIVILEEGAQAEIIDLTSSFDNLYGLTSFREIYLKENSKLNYSYNLNLSNNTYCISKTNLQQEKNSIVNWHDLVLNGKFVQHHAESKIIGDKAIFNHTAGFITTNEHDLKSTAIHLKGDSKSSLTAKGIVTNKSKSLFQGRIKISQEAHSTESHQKADILLLGKEAKGEAIPILEVDNKNVICSHGATISPIDEEMIYYLQSRGLSKKEAQHEIVKGFMNSIIKKNHLNMETEIIKTIKNE